MQRIFLSLAFIACLASAGVAQGPAGRRIDPSVEAIKANVAQILLDLADIEAKVDVLKADGDARDIAIAALTSPNLPTIEFDAVSYVVAELISQQFSGTWTDPNASASERVAEVYFLLNGQDITDDGVLGLSDTGLTSGTFTLNTGPLNLLLEGQNITVNIVDSDGNTGSASVPLGRRLDAPKDGLRELAGHPNSNADAFFAWTIAPTWVDDSSSNFAYMRPGEGSGGLERTTTGYHGAAGIDGVGSKATMQWTAIGSYQRPKLGIAIPSGSVLNWEVTANSVSVGTGTVSGPVYLMGAPEEITVDLGEYTISPGQQFKVELWTTVGGGAPSGDSEKCYLQYTELEEDTATKAYPGVNYFVDSVAGNNGTAVEGDPSLPWASLRYLLENETITSGSADTPTYIWVKRGHSETSVSGSAGALTLKDKSWVIIKPYGSGPLPVFDADYEAPSSGVHWTATNTGSSTIAERGFLNITNCVNVGVEGLKIIDSAGSGIRIDNTAAGNPSNISTNCWVRYCHVVDALREGIYVDGTDLDSLVDVADIVGADVSFNWVEGAGAAFAAGVGPTGVGAGQALTFNNCDGGSIIGNYLDKQWREGIDLIRCDGSADDYIRVIGNRVYGDNTATTYTNTTAIYCDASNRTASYILFEGNWIGGSSDWCKTGLACVAESGGTASNIIYRNNLVHDVGTNCFTFNDNSSGGPISNITIQGNTFEVPSTRSEFVIANGSSGSVTGITVVANSISRPSAGAALNLMSWAGATKTLTDNHFYNGSQGVSDSDLGTSAVTGDPQWTTDTSDFFPFSHGYYPGASSPLLQETSLNAKRDMYKVRRGSTHDIGAFERP